jgi:hypothetical protein
LLFSSKQVSSFPVSPLHDENKFEKINIQNIESCKR